MACLQPWWHSSYLSNSAEDIAKKRCAICSGEPQPGDAYWNGKYYYGILVKGGLPQAIGLMESPPICRMKRNHGYCY